MPRVEVTQQLTPTDRAAVSALRGAAARAGAHRFLDDEVMDLCVLARKSGSANLVGFAQATREEAGWSLELVVDPRSSTRLRTWERLMLACIDAVGHEGGGSATVWVHDATPGHDAMAGGAGLDARRDLYQMRRRLPLDEPSTLPTHSFVVDRDEGAWLAVNNRAFAGHPDQGGWTLDRVRRLEAEPWFDPEGFLLHERDGRLAGFCWTRVHREVVPPVGELYVVAVDPEFQGMGLGRQLVVAGLESLSRRRLDDESLGSAVLYVDASNQAALRLYRSTGFELDHVDRAYVGAVPPINVPSP